MLLVAGIRSKNVKLGVVYDRLEQVLQQTPKSAVFIQTPHYWNVKKPKLFNQNFKALLQQYLSIL